MFILQLFSSSENAKTIEGKMSFSELPNAVQQCLTAQNHIAEKITQIREEKRRLRHENETLKTQLVQEKNRANMFLRRWKQSEADKENIIALLKKSHIRTNNHLEGEKQFLQVLKNGHCVQRDDEPLTARSPVKIKEHSNVAAFRETKKSEPLTSRSEIRGNELYHQHMQKIKRTKLSEAEKNTPTKRLTLVEQNESISRLSKKKSPKRASSAPRHSNKLSTEELKRSVNRLSKK